MATLNGSTSLGVASITASYTAPGGRTIRTTPVTIEFVQPGQLLLTLVADPQAIYSDDQEVSTVELTVERDGVAVGGQRVDFSLSAADAALATFGAQGTTPSINAAQRITNPSGEASIEVRGLFAGAAGSVVVRVSTEDAQNGNQVVESSLFVLLKRHPLLQSVVFVGADPAVLGTQGSPRPSTAVVTFQAFDDNSEPMEGIEFRFLRPITIDPLVSITTVGGGDTTSSDSSGSVIAYLSAGVQAHPVRVIAEATDPRTGLTITVTSDAIPITSGLASFTHSWLVCDYAKEAMDPPDERTCQVVLADRFSERVPAGHSVQLRVESGNITPNAATSADGAAGGITFLSGYPMPSDTLDLSDAFDSPNPRDMLVGMLAYTRGEEPFTDSNGNGAYDPGEPFVDFPEPFLDKNDDCLRNDATDPADDYYVASGDPYEVLLRTDNFVDGNNDGSWNGGNNAWDDDTLIWFQDRTLYVSELAAFQWVDVECAAGQSTTARCSPTDGIRRITKGESITIRYRVIDAYGNCPAPGSSATYSYSAENAEGSGDAIEVGCGLGTGRYFVDPATGYTKPYCRVWKDLELAPDLTPLVDGVGSYPPDEAIFSTASSDIGVPIKITITFNGNGTRDYPIDYLIPCENDQDCGAPPPDPNAPAGDGPTCNTAGLCLNP